MFQNISLFFGNTETYIHVHISKYRERYRYIFSVITTQSIQRSCNHLSHKIIQSRYHSLVSIT